jgi:hypothetical protein
MPMSLNRCGWRHSARNSSLSAIAALVQSLGDSRECPAFGNRDPVAREAFVDEDVGDFEQALVRAELVVACGGGRLAPPAQQPCQQARVANQFALVQSLLPARRHPSAL